MKIKPLQNWVVVEQDPEEEVSFGGIIIPDAARQKQEQGTVLAVGEGRFVEEESKGKGKKKKEKTFVKTTLNPGDHILYEQYATRDIEVDGERFLLVREEDVLGLLS
jgi:chaperonin GroES